MESPSKALAESIVRRLVSDKLLNEAAGKKVRSKLAAGTMTSEDWRLALELSVATESDK